MDSRLLELKIVSANDLKKPSTFSPSLQPYVVVSVSGVGGPTCPAQKTPIDSAGGRNPIWNYPLTFPLPSGVPIGGSLRFQILSSRALAADKLVGEVCVPFDELFNSPAADTQAPAKFVSYQVKRPSGRPKGVLTFSFKLAGRFSGAAAAEEPVMAYPAPKTPATSTANFYPPLPSAPPANVGYPAVAAYKQDVYPPPVAPTTSYGYPAQVGYGYGYPGQTGYGYGSGYGYGYSGPVVQPNRKKNNGIGLGLGAGLLGGALAGLVVGDLVSDVAFDFGGGDGFF